MIIINEKRDRDLLTLEEFAEYLSVSKIKAYKMARSPIFQDKKIAVNVSGDPNAKKCIWRIKKKRYEQALEKGWI